MPDRGQGRVAPLDILLGWLTPARLTPPAGLADPRAAALVRCLVLGAGHPGPGRAGRPESHRHRPAGPRRGRLRDDRSSSAAADLGQTQQLGRGMANWSFAVLVRSWAG